MTEIKKPKILVIDDDPSVNKLLSGVLPANGYEVLTSPEAPEGLELAMKNSPDLIVLDVMMPVINGFNICRLLKTQAQCKHIPIILLTSRSTDEDRRIGEEVGADGYVAKPFNTEELLAKMKSLLETNLRRG